MERALDAGPLAEPLSPNIWKESISKVFVLEEKQKLRSAGPITETERLKDERTIQPEKEKGYKKGQQGN